MCKRERHRDIERYIKRESVLECVRVCMCVCVREREREREKGGGKERGRKRDIEKKNYKHPKN